VHFRRIGSAARLVSPSLTEVVFRQGDAAQVESESRRQVFQIRTAQDAPSLYVADLDSTVNFVGWQGEIPFEVNSQLRKAVIQPVATGFHPLQKRVTLVFVDFDSLPEAPVCLPNDSIQLFRSGHLAKKNAWNQLIGRLPLTADAEIVAIHKDSRLLECAYNASPCQGSPAALVASVGRTK
jgi:hypothetical protein